MEKSLGTKLRCGQSTIQQYKGNKNENLKETCLVSLPKQPETIQFIYDEEAVRFDNGESCILADHQEGTNRVTLFSSKALFQHFCRSKLAVSDGTFKVTPTLFKQLFILHGVLPGRNEVSYPMIFALLTGK